MPIENEPKNENVEEFVAVEIKSKLQDLNPDEIGIDPV